MSFSPARRRHAQVPELGSRAHVIEQLLRVTKSLQVHLVLGGPDLQARAARLSRSGFDLGGDEVAFDALCAAEAKARTRVQTSRPPSNCQQRANGVRVTGLN
jgi:hypothetical protein